MPDTSANEPLDQLRSLAETAGRAAHGMPGAQARALGTRRRRRRLTAATGTALLAVATFAGGVYAAISPMGQQPPEPVAPAPTTRPSEPASPDPTPDPAPAPTTIPPDYRIDGNLPDYGSDGSTQGPNADVAVRDLTLCGEAVFPGDVDPVDRLGVVYEAPEYEHVRLVQLYGDASEADAVMQQIADAVASCPEMEYESDISPDLTGATLYDLETTSVGDNSFVVTTQYEVGGEPTLGMELHQLVRVGSAVLLVAETNEGDPRSETVDDATAELTDTARTLAEDLCASDPEICDQ